MRTWAKLVMASFGIIALAACGNAASSGGAGAASANRTVTAARGDVAAKPSASPSPPASAASAPSPVTMQAVGSEIIRYWVSHKASIGNYSLVQNDVVLPDAKCVTLFSNQALATFVKSQATQDLAAPNEPNAEAAACATGNFATGDITVVGLSSSQLSAPPGPNDLLYIDDSLLNGTWDLIARQGTPQAIHHVQLTPVQVAEAVNTAFAFAAAHIPSGG